MKKVKRNRQRLKFGANNSLVIIFMVACAILINILAQALEAKVPALKIDLTASELTKMTDVTKNVLKTLDEGGTTLELIYLKGTGDEDSATVDLMGRYDAYSKNISSKTENYVKNPTVLSKYGVESSSGCEGAVVVYNEERGLARVIYQSEIWQQSGYSETFLLENRLTNAIGAMMSTRTLKACFSEGHGEADSSVLEAFLTAQNVSVTTLDLSMGEIPSDTDVFFLLSPTADFTQDEIDSLDTYLSNGGNAVISFGFNISVPRIAAYLKGMGIEARDDLILEQDVTASYQQSGMYFFPYLSQSAVSEGIDAKVFAAFARSLVNTPTGDISASPLLYSSSDAVSVPIKDGAPDEENMAEGQYVLGYLLEKPVNGSYEDTSKIIVTSTPSLWGAINEIVTNFDYVAALSLSEASFGNSDFVMNCISYASDYDGVSVAVPNKDVSVSIMNFNAVQSLIFIAVFCVILPLFVIIMGFVVWLKRRHL